MKPGDIILIHNPRLAPNFHGFRAHVDRVLHSEDGVLMVTMLEGPRKNSITYYMEPSWCRPLIYDDPLEGAIQEYIDGEFNAAATP